jgi:DNA-binding transcriptional LysR family regulator
MERSIFARTATALAVDVSVLRRRMQTLEAFIGAPLFEGRGNRLRLTAAGRRARVQAVRTLEAAAELALIGVEEPGLLRIACTGTILAEVLPPALRALRQAHPKLSFRIRRAGGEASRTLLANDEVDFAVVRGPARPDGLSSVRLSEDRLWWAVRAGHDLAKAPRLTMASLAREPLIGYPPTSSTMRRVMSVLGPHGASPWLEVDGKSAALAYVAAGLGIAFVSAVAWVQPEREGVVARDVTAHFEPTSFWLVWREGAALGAMQRRFVDELQGGTRKAQKQKAREGVSSRADRRAKRKKDESRDK